MLRAQVAPRPVGVLVGLQSSVNPLRASATYARLADRPIAERARRLAEPDARVALVTELHQRGVRLPLGRLFELGDRPDYEPRPEDSVAARAGRAGVEPIALLVDLLLADEGRALLYLPFLNYFDGDLEAAGEMLTHPFTVPGLGDGGAHVGTICDASFPTTLLTHWCRDRDRGPRVDVAWAVHRQSRATAEAVGLLDRGLVAPGYKADLNVIDLDGLALRPPTVVTDLPAGGARLLQAARGYRHTFVSGIETYVDGEPTGEAPGRLVRHHRPDPR
jgi:N-acyl-D-aspartate/D-glutamate deacylase